MSARAGKPLLLETACRLRAVPQSELAEFRRGWAGVQALLSVNPSVSPSPLASSLDFLGQAVPEIWKVQPRGVYRKIFTDGRYLHDEFARDLGGGPWSLPVEVVARGNGALTARVKHAPARIHRE